MKTRESNIELLRIISMIFIVFHHVCINNGLELFIKEFHINHVFVAAFGIWGTAGFTTFLVISFWYMLEEKYQFSITKILKLFVETVVYSFVAVIISRFIFSDAVGAKDLIKSALSPVLNTYWFVTAYLIIYCVLPYIRKLVNSLGDSALTLLAVLTTIIVPVYKAGYSPAPIGNICLVLYIAIMTAWVKKNYDRVKKISGIMCIIIIVATMCIEIVALYLGSGQGIIYGFFVNRWSPTQLWLGISLFIWFREHITLKSKFVNALAKTMFGLYILHASPCIATHIWQDVFGISECFNSNLFVVKMFFAVVVVFMIGLIIAFVVNYISNLIRYECKPVREIDKILNNI